MGMSRSAQQTFVTTKRTILLDRMVGDFIRKNPNVTVINIACGMDTRAYRLKIGSTVRWYNIDLPETIEVRRRFLEENGHNSMIAKSAMDERWADEIEEPKGRALVIIEGLVMYLSEQDVKQILSIISKRIAGLDGSCSFASRKRNSTGTSNCISI